MADSIERVESEMGCEGDICPFTSQKLMGIALLGAMGSLALYYLYANLSPDTRQSIKDSISSKMKAGLQSITEP